MLFVSLTFGDLGSTAKERCQMVMRNFCWQQVINMLNTSSNFFFFFLKKLLKYWIYIVINIATYLSKFLFRQIFGFNLSKKKTPVIIYLLRLSIVIIVSNSTTYQKENH